MFQRKVCLFYISMILASSILFLSCKKEPAANFSADKKVVWAYQDVQFTDLSTNSPNSWAWTFVGGTPATSTEQNPKCFWKADSSYEVRLTVKKSKMSGSTYKINYITVKPNLVFWTNVDGNAGYINVYISASTPLDTANFKIVKNTVTGEIIDYSPEAPICGTNSGFSVNASGKIYFFAHDNFGYWCDSIFIAKGSCINQPLLYDTTSAKTGINMNFSKFHKSKLFQITKK